MDWYESVFELIDMRSFSNLWYWIALAVVWSTASHWVVGVPWDMITRARRRGGQAEADMMALLAIYIARALWIGREAGLVLLGAICFVLTALGMLGFWYGIEFAQAVFLILAPMSLVGALSLRTAGRLAPMVARGEPPYRGLIRHRIAVQGLGMVSIFVTAIWGMWQNMSIGVLGN